MHRNSPKEFDNKIIVLSSKQLLSSYELIRSSPSDAIVSKLVCNCFKCLLPPHRRQTIFNPLRAKFFRENINIYLNFVSFLHIDTTQVVEILTQIRQEPTYST